MADYQCGTKNETSYGARVTVDIFHEILPGEAIQLETGRSESQGLRARRVVPYADRFQPYHLGGSGTRQLEVLTLGFEWWLEHMLGEITDVEGDSNPSTPPEGVTAWIGTLGDLCGLSFTWQENVVMGACKNTDQALTWGGGKIVSWTLSCEVEGNLTLEVEVVFANHTTATALATASYPLGAEVMSWATGSVSIAGEPVPVTSWTLSCNNNLKTDRHYISGSGAAPGTARKEPVRDGDREITFECELDFEDMTHWDRFAALERGDTLAEVEVSCQGPLPITGTTYPELRIEIPVLRFDEVSLGQLQQEMSTQTIQGVVLDNGVDEPLTITYITETAA
jgi:hypothetical protein